MDRVYIELLRTKALKARIISGTCVQVLSAGLIEFPPVRRTPRLLIVLSRNVIQDFHCQLLT